MKMLLGTLYILLLPVLLWFRWNGEPGMFNVILCAWTISAAGYLILNEREK